MRHDSTTLSKREALDSLLAHGDVLIQLDPRMQGVDVPASLSQQPLLVLRLGLDMPVPIPDLTISDHRIQATLSFNREPYHVTVPWQAVFGMVSEGGQGLLWTGDVPTEVLEQMLHLSQNEDRDDAPQERRGGPSLVALDGGRGDGPAADPPPRSPQSPSLRIVK